MKSVSARNGETVGSTTKPVTGVFLPHGEFTAISRLEELFQEDSALGIVKLEMRVDGLPEYQMDLQEPKLCQVVRGVSKPAKSLASGSPRGTGPLLWYR